MIQATVQKEDKFSEFILPESYLRFSPVTAEIHGYSDQRWVVFDRRWFQSVIQLIRERFPQHYPKVFEEIGRRWGIHTYRMLENLAQEVFPEINQVQDLGMDAFQNLFTNHLAITGWGNFELKRRDPFLFVDLYESLIVDLMRDDGILSKPYPHTVCHFYAGFFSGIFSSLSNMELRCLEITCLLNGYEHCSFLLDNSEPIAQVEQKIATGLSPLDALDKVKSEIL